MRPADRRQMGRPAKTGAMLLLLISGVSLSGVAAAQRGSQRSTPPPPVTNQPITPSTTTQPGIIPPIDTPGSMDGGLRARMEEGRVKSANDDRHKRLATDVDKLVSLTNELKADLDKTSKDELSLDVIRKAQEIEKLAHDVQSRMKN